MAVTLKGSNNMPVQVVSVTKNDVSSTTSTTWANIPSLTATITPSSSTNKVLVIASIHGDNNNNGGMIKLQRNGTDVGVGTGATSARLNVTSALYYNNDANVVSSGGFSYLDSPGSTSAVVYTVQYRVGHSTGGTFTINRNISDTDAAYTGYCISTITLMEISA